jgi:hypothetical protein
MQTTKHGLVINSSSANPTFGILVNEALSNFTMDPLSSDDAASLSTYNTLKDRGVMPPYYCTIVRITEKGHHTVFETVSSWGQVNITLFGIVGDDDSLGSGDKAVFFNLVHNAYDGKTGLKFGNRTAMFKTDGVSLSFTHRFRPYCLCIYVPLTLLNQRYVCEYSSSNPSSITWTCLRL